MLILRPSVFSTSSVGFSGLRFVNGRINLFRTITETMHATTITGLLFVVL
jgi:hypothetical protein